MEYGSKQGRSVVATALRRDAEPVMVDLGSATEAGTAIQDWRVILEARGTASETGMRLRQQLWEPLLPHLSDASLIFVSTDGGLGQLPFAALPGKADGSYLIEDHAIVMLPVPRLLPQLMQREPGERLKPGHQLAAVLMGDVDYNAADKNAPTPSAPQLLASNSLRGVREGEVYTALPGTGP